MGINLGDIILGKQGEINKKMLVRKADLEDLSKCIEVKVNKIDLENMLDIQ